MSLWTNGSVDAGTELRRVRKTVTFNGTANRGAVGVVPLFTVTGDVIIALLVAFCTDDLTEATPTATLALGVTNNTTFFIGATTATGIDAGMFWIDTGPDANGVALPAGLKDILITQNIIGTVGGQAINGGILRVDCYWLPLSADGNVAS